MKYKTNSRITSLIVIALMVVFSTLVYAANSAEPSKPSSFTLISNSTNAYPIGQVTNRTRGYIYTINIHEKQPTLKWAGFVGNITGSFALQDSKGFALYDWTIATTTGEVYASRHGESVNDIPNWENLVCASSANLTQEEEFMNHSISYGASSNEDSMSKTFTTGVSFSAFDIGEEVTISPGSCLGANLNRNDTNSGIGQNWTQVVLKDGTTWDGIGLGYTGSARYRPKLTYASIIQNDSMGFNPNETYDFQMILPMNGLTGSGVTVDDIAYYFYIELI